MKKIDQLKDAIMKKALGYDTEEVVEEYASDQEEIRLNKRKVTVKHIPPDLTAIKWMMEYIEDPIAKTYQSMSKEELMAEKIKLLEKLEELNGNKTSQN